MRVTMRDVAEAAGVSTMAVSVVLSGSRNKRVTVSEEKAQRIRQIAEDLHYRPNTLARSLRTQKTGAVAVVFQHFGKLSPDRPYRIQVLNGVTEALFSQGYSLSLCPQVMNDRDANLISDGRFDGVLWCRPDFTDSSVESIRQANVPVVMMHAPPGAILGVPTFCADNDAAMRRVVAHLLALGHERLAFVIDPVSINTVEGQTRCQSFFAAAAYAGLPDPGMVVLPLDHSILACYAEDRQPHTALVCFSDELAGQVLGACERFGIHVPDDLSVTGFDSSWFCDRTKPRLTSVNQPVERMAFEATTHLLSLIRSAEEGNSPSTAVSSIYDCGLDIRESTAPPRAHRRDML